MNKQGVNGISWCDYTWNPVTGCLHGCKYCYARKIAHRFGGTIETAPSGGLHVLDEPIRACTFNGNFITSPYPYMFEPTFHRYRLDEPQKVKEPSKIFVVSMGDLFGEWVPDKWIIEVLDACAKAPQHRYMFLTKNPGRLHELHEKGILPKAHWYGCTVENDRQIFMITENPRGLFAKKGYKTFASIEPLMDWWESETIRKIMSGEYIKIMKWVIIGQQTNPNIPPKDEWVQNIIKQCKDANVPVFIKSPLYKRFPIQEWPEGLKED